MIVAVALLIAVTGQHSIAASRVIDMSANFRSSIGEYDAILVKFFAPWCGHCKSIAPIFEKASDELSAGHFGEVDCTTTEGRVACEQEGIKGFPTLKMYKKGKFVKEYDSPRTKDALVSFVERNAAPAFIELKTPAQFDAFIGDATVLKAAFVGFFDADHSAEKAVFESFADHSLGARFAVVTDNQVLSHANQKNVVVFYQAAALRSPKLEASQVVFEGSINSQEELGNFVRGHKYGKCGVRNRDNMADFSKPLLVAYFRLSLQMDPKQIVYVRNRMMGALDKSHSNAQLPDLTVAMSDMQSMGDEMASFGVAPSHDSKRPIVALFHTNGKKYLMDLTSTFNVDNLVSFVGKVVDNQIEAHIKSQPIPEDPLDEGLHTVVGRNFDEVVLQSDKDVFVEFYAPWCGHCKKLAPVLTEVAKDLKADADKLILAKVNAVENEFPANFEVSGYPTMYFVPRNDKSHPVKYTGGRSKDDFIKYLAARSTDQLSSFARDGSKVDSKEL